MVHVLSRAALLYAQPPDEDKTPGDADWIAAQRAAFNGLTFKEHLDQLLGPLVFTSQTWSSVLNGEVQGAVIDTRIWLSETSADPTLGHRFIESLALSRSEARSLIEVRADGIPQRTSAFFRKPFISIDDTRFVCLSPRLLYEQLQLGTWAGFRATAKKTERWLRDFGTMFELWIRRVAREAAEQSHATAPIRQQLLISDRIGTELEIEDVVLRNESTVVLFSVKGALVRESAVHGSNPRETIQWYEQFLFEPKGSSSHREHRGAVIKLQQKIDLIRSGKWPSIPSNAYIIPVIITYEPLYENPALYTWIKIRCDELNLLRNRTWPLILGDVDDFEYLMGLAAQGHNVLQILNNKSTSAWRGRNLDALAYEFGGRQQKVRLAFIEEEFKRLGDRMSGRLFPSRRRPPTSPAE